MSGPVVLVGAGGHGRELLDLLEAANTDGAGWQILGFLSDHPVDDAAIRRRGQRILGPVALLESLDAAYLLAIGDGRLRRVVERRIIGLARPVAAARHPSGSCAADAEVGEGLVLAAGARVGPGARVGRHVHLNTNATISAGAIVGDFVTVSPGAVVAGGARVGEGAFVGVGALVLPGSDVAPDTMIGAGAVVDGRVDARAPLVGNPAHPTR